MEGNLHFQINWASLIVESKFTVLAQCFTLYVRTVFQVQSPVGVGGGGGLYLEGWFNRGFFCITILRAYTCRGLLLEFYSNYLLTKP